MYGLHGDKSEWITGLNLLTDNFSELKTTATPLRNYDQQTIGVFVQNSLKINERFKFGIRFEG